MRVYFLVKSFLYDDHFGKVFSNLIFFNIEIYSGLKGSNTNQ